MRVGPVHPAPVALLLLFAGCGSAMAQRPHTANTLGATEGMARPAARLADAAWLEGAWEGEGLGGWNEEVWSAPLAGSMMGVFRHVKGGGVVFYEIMTLVETQGTLELRLRHFHPDLRAWEEKDDLVRFPLVAADSATLWFDGLTLRRDGRDGMTVWLALERGESTKEAGFTYRRRSAAPAR